ncbi:MAG: NAD-dependent epimerase/dehydratase family protein [Pseudomonadota bacterium]|nr:NAD-dependent epimerase/dehydratase family protein [Pseudomonadota bacterium]
MSEIAGARVLVTGGHGFLGRHVCDALTDAGATPLPVGRAEVDLRDGAAVRGLFDRTRPDLVVHAAVTGGGIGWMRAHPADAFVDNVRMSTEVMDSAWRAGVRRFCGVSSACAYAVDAVQPMREEALFAGDPEPTNGPYGHAKRAMMVQGAAYAAQHGFDSVFVVPTNLYGPGESVDPGRAHVVGALVRRFEEACRADLDEVTCWGTGRATRDLLFVRDAAAGIVAALERGAGPAPVNLGSGDERTIEEIARAIAGAVGFRGRIRWDAAQPDGMPRKVLDIARARSLLGWTPRTPLAEGLVEMVAWFRGSSSSPGASNG